MKNAKVKLYYDKFSHYYKKVYKERVIPELVLYDDNMEGSGFLDAGKKLLVGIGLLSTANASGLKTDSTLPTESSNHNNSLTPQPQYENNGIVDSVVPYPNPNPISGSLPEQYNPVKIDNGQIIDYKLSDSEVVKGIPVFTAEQDAPVLEDKRRINPLPQRVIEITNYFNNIDNKYNSLTIENKEKYVEELNVIKHKIKQSKDNIVIAKYVNQINKFETLIKKIEKFADLTKSLEEISKIEDNDEYDRKLQNIKNDFTESNKIAHFKNKYLQDKSEKIESDLKKLKDLQNIKTDLSNKLEKIDKVKIFLEHFNYDNDNDNENKQSFEQIKGAIPELEGKINEIIPKYKNIDSFDEDQTQLMNDNYKMFEGNVGTFVNNVSGQIKDITRNILESEELREMLDKNIVEDLIKKNNELNNELNKENNIYYLIPLVVGTISLFVIIYNIWKYGYKLLDYNENEDNNKKNDKKDKDDNKSSIKNWVKNISIRFVVLGLIKFIKRKAGEQQQPPLQQQEQQQPPPQQEQEQEQVLHP